jgi:hypothetical protein
MRDTIDMAREVKATAYTNRHYPDRTTYTFGPEQLEAFEALVRADEREACAKVCDEQVERSLAALEKTKRITDQRIYRAAAQTATWNAAAIRARGNT